MFLVVLAHTIHFHKGNYEKELFSHTLSERYFVAKWGEIICTYTLLSLAGKLNCIWLGQILTSASSFMHPSQLSFS